MDEFKVTVEQFDGPLDLMLHLIKEKELDLLNLDMNVLTEQYIAYLQGMRDMHLEIASEYLVELASLIEYKSRKLIPNNKSDIDDEYEEDPKERLVRRLLEYQQYKEVSGGLEELFEERQKRITRPMSQEADKWIKDTDNLPYTGNPYDLMKAMRRIMMRQRFSVPAESHYTVKEVSVEDREVEVRAMLDRLPATFRFEALTKDCEEPQKYIATFLAVLDLARQHLLYFTVEDDVIWFTRGGMKA